MFLDKVVNFKDFSRPNKEIKYFSRILTEFKDFWKNSSYVSGVSVSFFVALYVGMFVARANKVERTTSWRLGTN